MPRKPFWTSQRPVEPEDLAVMARAYAYLFGLGGSLVLLTLLLPSDSDRFVPGMVAPPLAAYVVTALMVLRGSRLPRGFFPWLPMWGAVLVTGVAISAGTTSFHAYALLYFWVVVSAFYFFSWWQAAPNLGLVAIGYGVVLLSHDSAPDRLVYWIMGISTVVVTAVLLAVLRDRIGGLVEALRESDHLKTTILRSVSHDLRNPITAIMAAGEASGSPTLDDPERRRELASVITGEAERLSDLVEKLLDMSRLEGGVAVPQRISCSVEEIVESALERMPDTGVGFTLSADPALPSVWADAAQLERALANLLDNSTRYANGQPVEVTLEGDHDQVVVRIADHGPGIDPAEQERIFEPFFRSRENGATHRGGAGLGLAIAKGFIEANGGRIRVEPGGPGATFRIEIPAQPSAAVGEASQPAH
jgi:signal transduction histidine kinase